MASFYQDELDQYGLNWRRLPAFTGAPSQTSAQSAGAAGTMEDFSGGATATAVAEPYFVEPPPVTPDQAVASQAFAMPEGGEMTSYPDAVAVAEPVAPPPPPAPDFVEPVQAPATAESFVGETQPLPEADVATAKVQEVIRKLLGMGAIEDARRVAQHYGVPIDFESNPIQDFLRDTVKPAVSEVIQGGLEYGPLPIRVGSDLLEKTTGFSTEEQADVLAEIGTPVTPEDFALIAGAGLGRGAAAAARGEPLISSTVKALASEALAGGLGGPGVQRTRAVTEAAGGAFHFVEPLRAFDDVEQEVVNNTGVVGNVVAGLGFNPSLTLDSPVERAVTTYQRQRATAEELTNVAVSSALDPHAQRVTGRMGGLLPIDDEAFMNVNKVGPGGAVTKAKVQWNDAFARPQDYLWSDAQQRYLDDYRQVIDETEAMRLSAGLPERAAARVDDLYVPRQVRTRNGVELVRPTNPNLQRIHELAQEGFDAGVRYDNNPRAVLELHVRNAYNEIIEKQLADALEPLSIGPNELISAPVRIRYEEAVKARQAAERAVRATKVSRPLARAENVVRDELSAQRSAVIATISNARDAMRASGRALVGATPEMRSQIAAARRATDAAQKVVDDTVQLMGTPQFAPQLTDSQVSAIRDYTRAAQQELRATFTALGTDVGARTTSRIAQQRQALTAAREELNQVRAMIQPGRRMRDVIRADRAAAEARLVAAREDYRKAKNAYSAASKRAKNESVSFSGLFSTTVSEARATKNAANEAFKAANAAYRQAASGGGGSLGNLRNDLDIARQARNAANTNYADAVKLAGTDPEHIPIAMWRNRFYPQQDADLLNDAIGRFVRKGDAGVASALAKGVGTAANYIRFLSAVGDLAMPFIQGLPVLASNPVAWARGAGRHYQAVFDPTVQARYIRDHLDTFQEMARNGVPIGDAEFFRAIQQGGGFSLQASRRLGGLARTGAGRTGQAAWRNIAKQTTGRFGASYSTGLGVMRAQLWEASKMEPASKAQWIRNLTGGLDPRTLGVGPRQQNLESMWMAFSPRLLRSTVALFADAARPFTPEGRAAARSLLQLAGGATTAYVMTGLAMGKDWSEIEEGLKPWNGKKFLSHNVNGDWIGIGGQVRAISQFAMNSIKTAADGDMENFARLNIDNPIVQFITSRGAPGLNIAGAALEAASGGNLNTMPYNKIDSLPDLAKHLGTSTLPFALQAVLEGQKALTSGAGFLGGRTSAGTPAEFRDAARDQVAREQFNRPYKELWPDERRDVDADERVAPKVDQARRTAAEQGSASAAVTITNEERRQFFETEADKVDAKVLDKTMSGPDARKEWDDLIKEMATEANYRRQFNPQVQAELKRLNDKQGDLTRPEQATADYFAIFEKPGVSLPNGDLDFRLYEKELKAWQEKYPEADKESVSPPRYLSAQHQLQEEASDRLEAAGYFDAQDHAFDVAKKAAGLPGASAQQKALLKYETLDDYRTAVEAVLRQAGTPETQIDAARAKAEAAAGLTDLIETQQAQIFLKEPKLIVDLERWYGAPKRLREAAAEGLILQRR